MMNNEEKITLQTEEGEFLDFFVVDEGADGECYVLKDTSAPEGPDASYEFVEDEQELNDLFQIFTQLLDDADVELQK